MNRSMCQWLVLVVMLGSIILLQAAPTQAATLKHGVVCHAETILVTVRPVPYGNATYHTVTCNRPVEMLRVQAAQSQETDGSLFFYEVSTCYNASFCSVYMDGTRTKSAFGRWLMDTAGTAGIPGDQYYYGYIPNNGVWMFCNPVYCERP
ncbi:MAG: hypothetical protein GFH27_549283n385 [Chloroflexi bacterium AL-W]|nr:hypothetical protein [Chloroflexi bacterium AL-N1]NOK64493.1 hypothetical protein [Chloroflexi bacterium AL-N10]NOK75735.1 hypothetical protein [Chloroflexi bacterium AL-N5]NOK80506.1 hypothetical protein [Chloroflexi bacterium AL-W]NOK87020.1 hypothetical protein [Chloroflexi bacterium AL-N15]